MEEQNQFQFRKRFSLILIMIFLISLISMLLNIFVLSRLHDSSPDLEKIEFYIQLLEALLIISLLINGLSLLLWHRNSQYENHINQALLAKIDAISKSQAIIEFNMDGTIIDANQKFLDLMNYSLDEIKGKHHSIFVEPGDRDSLEYREFWRKLNQGEYDQAEYKRLGKNGKEVWLQSSYNPVLNEKGKAVKVIKVATDITERKNKDKQLAALTRNLQDVGQEILSNSNELSVGINQLEASAISQAASASEQASSVTQISATLEEIKATTQHTLEKAKQLGDSATATRKEGENGRSAIEAMHASMKILQEKMKQISTTILSLNDKSQQISEITEVVADIAKQSKMLALNASIEAAKAGETGKGFAVVAGEVKELAEKSKLSTERVQKILLDIKQTAERAVMVTEEGNKSVDENIRQVRSTGNIINALGNVIEESSLASLQIVSAVREESVAIEQVDISVREINKVTHSFTSATEQTKQAIIGLSKVANSLNDTARIYQKDDKE
ncbi:methyl-accepting chemotaxis protein [Legionella genomosp. 1]|uniref:methyl-accepting chemotaxis protein n=1 Tax=Legionella genomosp. 1 TaxID=1093625 RepID=UPI001055BB12|nr:methyl-accepting chemotaxis protein [Legionella genomosp. 1]